MFMTRTEKIFEAAIVACLCLLSLIALVPLLSVLSLSFSSSRMVDLNEVTIWPREFNLDSWNYMLGRADLWKSALITLVSTLIGTTSALLITALLAYPLSKKEFKIGGILMVAVVVTMVFKAPLIPYFLTVKGIGLYNNPLVLIIPHVLSPFNLIIMRTFFRQFPKELEEAAFMEGCGYFRLLFQFVLPLSKAVLATLALFYGVMIWNQFQHPLLFIQNPDWFPLQIKIRQFVTDPNEMLFTESIMNIKYNERTLRAVTVVFAIIPVIIVYPFLQKYFVKGALIGSVKG